MDVIAIISAAITHDQHEIKVIDGLVNSNLIMTWPDGEKEHRVLAPISSQFGSISQVHSDVLAGIDFADIDAHDVFAGFLMFGAAAVATPKKLSFVSFLKHDDKEHWDKVIVDIEENKRLYLPIVIMYSSSILSIREAFAKIIDETFTAVETAAKITNV
jgi:hypothetical protein